MDIAIYVCLEDLYDTTTLSSMKTYPIVDFKSFFGKLTYVLKENDTKNIMGIPKIYNVNRNETNKWLQASYITKQKLRPTRYARGTKIIS